MGTSNNCRATSDALARAPRIRFCVAGVPAAILSRVFDPFFTTKEAGKGTGLGLSMVYDFVKQSGGHLKIYSEEGHGTTIRLYLPRAKREAEHRSHNPSPNNEISLGNGEILLVVEDNDDVRWGLVRQLASLKYRVLEVENAAKALKPIEQDVLLTDIVMPGGMNGMELARSARKRNPKLPVLLTSGFTETSIDHNLTLDQPVSLLSKPNRKHELARKIRAALRSHGA
jgi:CheY-like chemotaxis protein